MLEQEQYHDVLFVFNDNEEQYILHRDMPKSFEGCRAGGGNAEIRPYQCETPPRAAGIPTGGKGVGYKALTPDVKKVVDEAISSIANIAKASGYKRIFY